jgi:hypothetical protein
MRSIKMTTRTALYPCILALAALGTGCGSQPMVAPPATGQTSVAPSNALSVSDVPVPGGAKLDTEASLLMGGQEHWIGRLVIGTGLTPTEAYNFYQGKMPSFGWSAVTAVQSKISTLTFLRADRVATVQIEPNALSGSTVSVLVSPRQTGQEAPATTQPLRQK